MGTNNDKTFHLGLCMAGSISAGAYTAGVMDYLIEALENWEQSKKHDQSVPGHQVVIDLLCGSSGGGMTGAMTLFTLMDKMDHAKLDADGKTYTRPANNILWDCWVELSGSDDIFKDLLSNTDLDDQEVRSVLNASFIDLVADKLYAYINNMPAENKLPPFAGIAPEMFMTLFNVTGINYELHSKASSSSSSGKQFVSDHRDIAHFRWTENKYDNDGRIPLHLKNLEFLPQVIDAAKATGAFPIGLKARKLTRKAKFIWDNPFFNRGKQFGQTNLFLGKTVVNPDDDYTSINADGGTANNEPVELARDILLNMRYRKYQDAPLQKSPDAMDDKEKSEAKNKFLKDTSILLIDPFPSANNSIHIPDAKSDLLIKYGFSLLNAMSSQLIFDAKEALDAYKKENYGLHIVSPSKQGKHPSIAIACGSLNGFGGFLSKDFRVHDFFLGRHNCQSFIRKYFVVNMNEQDLENKEYVQSVIDSYQENPEARKRFAFIDKDKNEWVPVIPDTSLTEPLKEIINKDNKIEIIAENKLPEYNLENRPANFIKNYETAIANRYMGLLTSLLKTNYVLGLALKAGAWFTRKKVANAVIKHINADLKKRELI